MGISKLIAPRPYFAPYAAVAAAILPPAATIFFEPNCRATVAPIQANLSLKLPVGFLDSSLIYRFSSPNSRPSLLHRKRGVPPSPRVAGDIPFLIGSSSRYFDNPGFPRSSRIFLFIFLLILLKSYLTTRLAENSSLLQFVQPSNILWRGYCLWQFIHSSPRTNIVCFPGSCISLGDWP